MLVDAWLPSGVTETNTANNTVSKDFQWADAVSVRAYAINGPSSVEPRVNHEYEVSVANLGNLDAVDIPVRFLLNGKDLGATARVSIPARKVLNFSVKAKFQNSGQASLGMSVDPQHTSATLIRTTTSCQEHSRCSPFPIALAESGKTQTASLCKSSTK